MIFPLNKFDTDLPLDDDVPSGIFHAFNLYTRPSDEKK